MRAGDTRSSMNMAMLTEASQWEGGRFTFVHPRVGRVTIERTNAADTESDWVVTAVERPDPESPVGS
jgi:hypothetical protein